MAKKKSPLTLIIHAPGTEEGKSELARKTAEIHADAVLQTIRAFRGSSRQKEALLDAVIEATLLQTADS